MRPGRLPGWQQHLAALVARNARRPFAWGTWDCAQFAAAAIMAQTGRDLRPGWAYADRAEGVRRMRAMGYRDHLAWFRAHLAGLPVAQALPGDIAIMPGRALGVVQGRAVYQVTEAGLALAPIGLARGVLAV